MIEKKKPTHVLRVDVPLELESSVFPGLVVRDLVQALVAVLSVLRVSGCVADDPNVTLEEVPADGVE